MVRRASISLLLGLLLASSAAPSSAVILCVAADGHVSLELALPGTTRCDERDCDPHAAPAAQHTCRDIPVLSGGHSIVPATSITTPSLHAAAACSSPAPPVPGGGSQLATRRRWVPPDAVAERLRSVVLTL